MAKILSEFDFPQKGRKQMYPWGSWTDGKIRRIIQGKDFQCSTESMVVQVYNKARAEGKKVRISKTPEHIVFQFYREGATK